MSNAASSAKPGVAAPRQRVLCVDDDPVSLALVREILLRAGWEVECASNAAIARQLPHVLDFDAITTDHEMPDLDGLSFVASVRCAGFKGRVVVVSASAGPAEQKVYRALHVSAILGKPVSASELLTALQGP